MGSALAAVRLTQAAPHFHHQIAQPHRDRVLVAIPMPLNKLNNSRNFKWRRNDAERKELCIYFCHAGMNRGYPVCSHHVMRHQREIHCHDIDDSLPVKFMEQPTIKRRRPRLTQSSDDVMRSHVVLECKFTL